MDESTVATPATTKTKKDLGFWLAFGSIAIANLAAAFDATTLSVAIPAMSAELGGNSVQAFWAGTSYPLAQAAVMLLWVSLSQCFGRRLILVISLVLFGIGAILPAVAHSWTLVLVGRTIQGVGGGGLVGLTTVIITDLVPLRERGGFYAIISSVWALGTMVGPIIGGGLSNAGAWRWIFWINLPIVGVGLVGIVFFLKLSLRERSIGEKLRDLDYVGLVLFTASTTAFLIPTTWGGTQYAWGSWRTLVPLCLGAAGIVGFVFWEINTKGPKLIPMSIFRNFSTTALYFCSFIHGLLLFSIVYYMPEWFQAVKGYSPLMSGVAALPQNATCVPCAVAVGVIVGKTGRYRWAIWLGWATTTLGMGLLIYLHVQTSIPAWIFLTIVSGIGIGLLFPSIALAVQASTPPEEAATASTLVIWFRVFGSSLGVAIGGVIFQNRFEAELASVQPSGSISGDLPKNVVLLIEYIKHLPSGDPRRELLREILAKSFRVVWIATCVFAACAMLVSFFIKEYSMAQEHKTEQSYRGRGDRERDEKLSGATVIE